MSTREPESDEDAINSFARIVLSGIQTDSESFKSLGISNLPQKNSLVFSASILEKINKYGDRKYKIGDEIELPITTSNAKNKNQLLIKFTISSIFDDNVNHEAVINAYTSQVEMVEIFKLSNSIVDLIPSTPIYNSLVVQGVDIGSLNSISTTMYALGYKNSFALQDASRISPLASSIRTVGYSIIGILILGFIVVFTFQYSSVIRNRKYEFGILKTIGYNSYEIFELLVLEGIYIIFICSIFSLCIYSISFFYLKDILSKSEIILYPSFDVYFAGIIFFTIIVLSIVHISIIKIIRSNVMELIK